MSPTLFRYVLKQYLVYLSTILVAVLAIFLVADFVDRARSYVGANWIHDVSVLYGYKALMTVQQLAPGVMLLAAGVTVSSFRSRGELTAMRSLSLGPGVMLVPILVAGMVLGGSLILFDELVVGHASRRVDEITANRFHRWGEWRFYFNRKQWFRNKDRIFYLQEGDAEGGFKDVSLLRMTPEFSLSERLDAREMHYLHGTTWRLLGISERHFNGRGGSTLSLFKQQDYDLGVSRGPLNIRPGRPEQMRTHVLREQIKARRLVGLPDRLFSLALSNRFAYPLAGIPGALLAAALALRPGRKGHVTAAIVEGLGVAMVLWGLMVVGKSLVIAQHIRPALAAWSPMGILVLGFGALTLWPVVKPPARQGTA